MGQRAEQLTRVVKGGTTFGNCGSSGATPIDPSSRRRSKPRQSRRSTVPARPTPGSRSRSVTKLAVSGRPLMAVSGQTPMAANNRAPDGTGWNRMERPISTSNGTPAWGVNDRIVWRTLVALNGSLLEHMCAAMRAAGGINAGRRVCRDGSAVQAAPNSSIKPGHLPRPTTNLRVRAYCRRHQPSSTPLPSSRELEVPATGARIGPSDPCGHARRTPRPRIADMLAGNCKYQTEGRAVSRETGEERAERRPPGAGCSGNPAKSAGLDVFHGSPTPSPLYDPCN
jgi:hypothetical protein